MTELEKSAEKTSKLKRWGPVLAVLLIGAVILLVYIISANQPLDKIQDYQVEVTPVGGRYARYYVPTALGGAQQ